MSNKTSSKILSRSTKSAPQPAKKAMQKKTVVVKQQPPRPVNVKKPVTRFQASDKIAPKKVDSRRPGLKEAARKVPVAPQRAPPKAVLVREPMVPRRRNVMKSGLGSGGIPRTPATKGLHMPKPSNAEYQIHSRLKRKSPWYTSIWDPMHNADVKIPDSTGVETGVLQLVQRVPLVVSNEDEGFQAACGLRTICLHPNLSGSGPTPLNYQDLCVIEQGTNEVSWPIESYKAFDSTATLQAYSQGVRIVSAAIYIQSEASLENNSGMITAYCIPYPTQMSDADGAANKPLSYYQNRYKSTLIPINNNQPAVVRWFPVKQDGGMYDMFYIPTQGAGPGYSGDGPDCPYWEMGLIISGCVNDTQFEATIVVNYEFLPLNNAVNIISAAPSPEDAEEINLVENWVQDMPIGNMSNNKTVSKSPSTSEVVEPGLGTGFGMFAEVVCELLPFLL